MRVYTYDRIIRIYDIDSKITAVEWVDICKNEKGRTVFQMEPKVQLCFRENSGKVKQELMSQFSLWKQQMKDFKSLHFFEDLN